MDDLEEAIREAGFGSVDQALVEFKGSRSRGWPEVYPMARPFPTSLTELFRAGKLKDPMEAEEYGRSEWRQLRDSIREVGIENPLWLSVDFEKRRAYLSEGKHRSKMAEELGIEWVPVVIFRDSLGGRSGAKIPKELGLHDPGGDWMSPQDVFPGLGPSRLCGLPADAIRGLWLLDMGEDELSDENVEQVRRDLGCRGSLVSRNLPNGR
jgi:hypothetical protein